jgi:hypothetical protein
MPPTEGAVTRYIDPGPLTDFVLLDDGMAASCSFAFRAAGLCDLCSCRAIVAVVSMRGARDEDERRAGMRARNLPIL